MIASLRPWNWAPVVPKINVIYSWFMLFYLKAVTIDWNWNLQIIESYTFYHFDLHFPCSEITVILPSPCQPNLVCPLYSKFGTYSNLRESYQQSRKKKRNCGITEIHILSVVLQLVLIHCLIIFMTLWSSEMCGIFLICCKCENSHYSELLTPNKVLCYWELWRSSLEVLSTHNAGCFLSIDFGD